MYSRRSSLYFPRNSRLSILGSNISIEVNLVNALSKQNIRVNVPSRFTIGISTEPGVMQNAAERLLGQLSDIQELAKEIIFGQLRLVVASMDIEEINSDRDKFLSNISTSVESELKKVGLKLINVNITDIVDESGYIEALGKEAAAHAINAARKSVAEKNRDGSIGEANAVQDQRTQVAAANAKAVDGENTAKIEVANSNALRRQREAEAERNAIASEKVQAAKALEEAYAAEQEAEQQEPKNAPLRQQILSSLLKSIKTKWRSMRKQRQKNSEKSQRKPMQSYLKHRLRQRL